MDERDYKAMNKERNSHFAKPVLADSIFSHIGLFEGIGGFSLAAKRMGWETKAWCEWNEFGQKVLRHHFPNAEGFGDITKTDFTKYANKIDILTGGFPCQPYSLAGKRKGKEDERHLWPEMLRAVREIRPTYVVGENVFGLINWNGGMVFNEVQSDLEAEGYEVFPFVLPACAKNAPHRRDRVWFIAHCNSDGQHWSNSEYEKHTSKRGEYALGNSKQSGKYGIVTNPDNSRTYNGSRTNTEWEKENKGWKEQSFPQFREAIMHPNSTSEQREHIGQKREGKPNRSNSRTRFDNFQNFPTQSPICGGNDGIPDRLDNITIPKWRTESIKAFGNAIVPQVAFEIFKALELTHF